MLQTCIYQSPIGPLLLRADNEALCELKFLPLQQNNTVTSLQPNNDTGSTGAILLQTMAQLDDYFSGRSLQFSMAIQQAGSSFQLRVWHALRQIDAGSTLSYLQLSKKMGDAKAIRAVGTANGKNTIAIIVPCHRVIGSNGSLVGYSGELWRKKWLLEHEAKHCHGVQSLF